ncbi:radical SAM/SPASM domain-containing protein [Archaeoglobales archaeon]|nr:MAG: radical SAM/SPASM domain-containing protein [Archaeoglobales archaeon]
MNLDINQRPFIVFWELTRACMLACKHCRAKAQRKRHPNELTTHECFDVIEQLKEFGKPRPVLIVTGGDPLLRDDLFEIIEYATKNEFRVAIAFSGTNLATKGRLRKLKDVGVSRIAISIDGSNAEVHDSFRGVKGTFDMSLRILHNANKINLPTQINTTVTNHNIYDLPNIMTLGIENGVVLWDVFFVVPTGRARVEMMPTPQQFEDILNWLYDISKKTQLNVKSSAATHLRRIELMRDRNEYVLNFGDLYYKLNEEMNGILSKFENERIETTQDKKVVAGGHGRSLTDGIRRMYGITDGRGMFFISHTGEVYPSGFLPLFAGNVRRTTLRKIYMNSKIFLDLKNPNNLKGKCGICEYRFICGGSRARAYALTGDYLQEEPCCVYMPKIT